MGKMKDEFYNEHPSNGYKFNDDYFSIHGGSESDIESFDGFWNSVSGRTVSEYDADRNYEKKAQIKDSLYHDSSVNIELTLDLFDIQDELADILITKHSDYGTKNITDSPGGALNGIRVRMHDKIARLNNLIDNNREPKHESIRDTLIDIANYATIAIMVIDGNWDK